MEHIIRKKVLVHPGGSIEIRSDELREGTEAEVIIIVRTEDESMPTNYVALFGSGRGSFATPREADAFLRRERDAWEN